MKKFVCPVCGYVHEAEAMPEGFKCPLCKVDGAKFKVMEAGKLAAEHEYGDYGKTVKNNPDISEEDKKFIFDQLMANFQGECAEVGMYLCMARIAHREGYPEIGLYWEKAAFEEAEHAAKSAGRGSGAQHDRFHQEEPGMARRLRVRRYLRQVRPG